MSIIAEVDYDIIQPFIHKIIPLLIQVCMAPVLLTKHLTISQIPGRDGIQFALLDIILDYHTKTRTMDDLIQVYFTALSLPKSIPGDSRQTYQICSSSPIMRTSHLQKIARALKTFLTESQCLPIVDAISTTMTDTWQKIYSVLHQTDATDDNPRKKRRISTASVVDGEVNAQELAVTYSFLCRFAAVVLSSLPMTSLSLTTQEEVNLLLQNIWVDFVQHAVSKSLKLLKKSGGVDAWLLEITLASNLRLLYALGVSRKLSLPAQLDVKLCNKMGQLVQEVALPELAVEMVRSLHLDENMLY